MNWAQLPIFGKVIPENQSRRGRMGRGLVPQGVAHAMGGDGPIRRDAYRILYGFVCRLRGRAREGGNRIAFPAYTIVLFG